MIARPSGLVREASPAGEGKLIVPHKTADKRLAWVDYARGIAILLVIYRHTMVGLKRSGTAVPDFLYAIQEFFYNFRMPVFFILSGIFLSIALQKYPALILAKKKAMTLLYPYVLWAIILISLQIIMSGYTNSDRTARDYLYIITQPRELDHMWYLLVLFNTSFLFIFLWKWLKNHQVVYVGIALILHFSCFLIRDYSLFSDPFYYFIFLVTGALLSKRLLSLEKKETVFFAKSLLLLLPFFIAGQLFWLYMQPETFLLTFPFLAIILVACTFFYFLSRFLQRIGFALWLTEIGRKSLYIYILHLLVISSFRMLSVKIFGITNIYFIISGSLILGVLVPMLAYRILLYHWGMWYLFSLEKPKSLKLNG